MHHHCFTIDKSGFDSCFGVICSSCSWPTTFGLSLFQVDINKCSRPYQCARPSNLDSWTWSVLRPPWHVVSFIMREEFRNMLTFRPLRLWSLRVGYYWWMGEMDRKLFKLHWLLDCLLRSQRFSNWKKRSQKHSPQCCFVVKLYLSIALSWSFLSYVWWKAMLGEIVSRSRRRRWDWKSMK